MKRIRVGVVFGGRSGEHEISLRSAVSVLSALDRSSYEVVPIGITKEGQWLSRGPALELLGAEREVREAFERGTPMALVPQPDVERGLDVVFPVLHGTFGEDGAIQGLCELADVAYVGAGVLGSAVGMDKDVMKRLLREAGLPVVDHWTLLKSEAGAFVRRESGALPYPVFVKPANLGSSVGITKVSSPEGLAAAIEEAALYDRKVVVERGIDAREIELSVLGNDEVRVSVPGEILPSRDFYDYEAKYVDEGSELVIPAALEPAQTSEAQRLARLSFKILECAGFARVDLLLERKTDRFFVNEINTLPGFTSISMFPRLWEASGITYSELLDELIRLAIERHRERSGLRTSYKHLTDG